MRRGSPLPPGLLLASAMARLLPVRSPTLLKGDLWSISVSHLWGGETAPTDYVTAIGAQACTGRAGATGLIATRQERR